MKHALVAGSFDPVTHGHLWMITRALEIFDTVTVGIATNPNKKSLFTAVERHDLISASLQIEIPNLKIAHIPENMFTVDYANAVGATHIVRGIRNGTDFDYEHQINLINSEIGSNIQTIYVMPPRELMEVSSSVVKSLIGVHGWEKIAYKYVTWPVLEKLKEKASRV